jgi:CubicO group peptidase (beta-lactamase class C family)
MIKMRIPQLKGAMIVLTLCLSAAAYADDLSTVGDSESLGFSSARLARITAWYQARVDARDLPGAVVAIARNGKLAYLEAIGFEDHGKQIPIKPDAIFWIASMSKPVTSAAAMILVEEGKLELDAPVSRYLPELKDMQVGVEKANSVTGKDEIELGPQKREMTVRDLLRHTSGLVYPPQFVDSPIHRLYRKAVFARDKTLADFTASLAQLPLAHQPGEVWEYSHGVDVLGRVVEVASGEPFDQFLQDRIFGPLHMVDTGFYVPEEKLGRLVDPPDAQRPPLWDVTTPPKLFSGGGGLVSTAPDYLRFCQMWLNGGELDGVRILTAQTVQLMTTNSLPPDIRFVGDFVGPAAGSGWGLGFAIRTDPANSFIPGSVGSYTWGGLWGTYFWVDPAEKLVAVQMIQLSSGGDPYLAALRHLTYGALTVPTQPPAPSPATMNAEELTDYAGTYDFGSSTSARDKRIGRGGVGIASVAMEGGAVKVIGVVEGGPAGMAGVVPGDLITQIDDATVKDMTFAEAVAKDRGAVGSKLRLKIVHKGQDSPVEVTLARTPLRSRAVELRAQVDNGRLFVESVGAWPILDFEKEKPLMMMPQADGVFYLDSGDHTRIAFIRDSNGKVTEAVLNPGLWELRGRRLE